MRKLKKVLRLHLASLDVSVNNLHTKELFKGY